MDASDLEDGTTGEDDEDLKSSFYGSSLVPMLCNTHQGDIPIRVITMKYLFLRIPSKMSSLLSSLLQLRELKI